MLSKRVIARRVLYPPLVALWDVLFQIAGLTLRPHLQPIEFTGSDRVLVVAPHPDDETIGCGGAVAMHRAAGDAVVICVVTDGAGSRAGGMSAGEMRARRSAEARQAARELGDVGLIQLELLEWEWEEPHLVELLRQVIGRTKPSLVYSTSPVDYHPEHTRVALCLAQALQNVTDVDMRRVRLYEVQVPLTPILATVACELTPNAVLTKSRALKSYRTQTGSLVWLARSSRYQRRLYRVKRPLEVFCELSIASFSAITTAPKLPRSTYRGIRAKPFTDPLAWLAGTRERIRLMGLLRGN